MARRRKILSLIRLSLVTSVILPFAAGCTATLRPGPPGTIGMQRQQAALHDPFPSNELGPPIVGGRPLGFDRPQSEPTAIQSSPWARR